MYIQKPPPEGGGSAPVVGQPNGLPGHLPAHQVQVQPVQLLPTPQGQVQPAQSGSLPAPPVSLSYSDRVKARVQRSERYKRNVLEINLEFDESHVKVEKEVLAKTFSKLGIDIKSQVEGYQVTFKKIFVWCKDQVNLDKFCKDECFRVTSGVKTGIIKPMERKSVPVTIRGLNFNTPDSLVMEYINKFGIVVNNKVIYETDREGPLAGLRNGDRKYLVDFTNGRNMGTFHLIDGSNVNVRYNSQRKTCGRCHRTPLNCPGAAWAKTCEEKGGNKVTLRDHMKALWAEIGFKPEDFKLDYDESEENLNADVEIKENGQFTPPHKSRPQEQIENDKFNGVVIKNLPKDIPDREITLFLESKGLPIGHKGMCIGRNIRNTNVDISNLPATVCNTLIGNIHENVFFNNKIYCRGISDIMTPEKVPSTQSNPTPEKVPPTQSNPTPEKVPPIQSNPTPEKVPPTQSNPKPGPSSSAPKSKSPSPKANDKTLKHSQHELGSARIKKDSKPKSPPKESFLKIVPGLPVEDLIAANNKKKKKKTRNDLGKPDYQIKTKDGQLWEEDFVFDEVDNESSSDEGGKGFFHKSPLDPETDGFLTPNAFKSRTAKTIQKEELWNLSLQKAGNTLKRPLNLSPEDPRRTKSRSICLD